MSGTSNSGVDDISSWLDDLEQHYGVQMPGWPADAYEFLVWWHCGYPATEERCNRGWQGLKRKIGIQPRRILQHTFREIAEALEGSGMVPELRAQRLHEIAARVLDDFGGDLNSLFTRPEREIRKELKKFPGIGDPGADRILLFSGKIAVPAVPSNCPHVLVRLSAGEEPDNYTAVYRTAKEALHAALPEMVEARQRAYLLLKAHGEEICTRKPKCSRCPLSTTCAFAIAGRSAPGSASI